MKIKTLLLVTILAVLFVVVPVQARLLYNDQPLPFKAHVSAQATAIPQRPPPWYMEVFGSGTCTHMGNITVYQHHMVVPAADGGVDFTDGYWLWTAANGDQVQGTYSGHMPFNPAGYFEIHGYFIIAGGTGRLVNARGEGPASGAQYLDGTADLRLDGIIYYQ
jgi:hypothetical protein